jgi:hypothetical protein
MAAPLEHELSALLEDCKVPRDVRDLLAMGGFETLGKFRHLAGTLAE